MKIRVTDELLERFVTGENHANSGYAHDLAHDLQESRAEVELLDVAGGKIALKWATVAAAYDIQAEELKDAYSKIEQLQLLLDGARGH
jgi:hypothetical protein